MSTSVKGTPALDIWFFSRAQYPHQVVVNMVTAPAWGTNASRVIVSLISTGYVRWSGVAGDPW